MQDCWNFCEPEARGHITIRWCPDHENWVVAAWAKRDGDSPFAVVHPMWERPRVVADDEHTLGTLQVLLSAVQSVTRRLSDEARSGQDSLF